MRRATKVICQESASAASVQVAFGPSRALANSPYNCATEVARKQMLLLFEAITFGAICYKAIDK
jgi:hypothetical protein